MIPQLLSKRHISCQTGYRTTLRQNQWCGAYFKESYTKLHDRSLYATAVFFEQIISCDNHFPPLRREDTQNLSIVIITHRSAEQLICRFKQPYKF